MRNEEELQATKRIEKFKKKFLKLMIEFPEITVHGDMNGDIAAHTYYESGVSSKHLYRSLPRFVSKSEKSSSLSE